MTALHHHLLLLFTLLLHGAAGLVSRGHLVVLIHGLAGTSEDLSFLGEQLVDRGEGAVQVLSVKSNMGQTTDGIWAGAERCAEEVERTVRDAGGRLSRISIVGNSLGGLYARAAATLLYDGQTGRIAGLSPDTFCTVAAPHLGVRGFTYVPTSAVPGAARRALASALVGRTGRELMLDDDDNDAAPLVYRMATEQRFLDPLRSFRRRRCYGNLAGDFMVPFSTALFNVSAATPRWGFLDDSINRHPSSSPKKEREEGLISWIAHTQGASSPYPAGSSSPPSAASATTSAGAAEMSRCLDSLGWSKVGCRVFQPAFALGGLTPPLAHNAIAALGRRDGVNRLLSGVWQKGRPIMDHCCTFLLLEESEDMSEE